VRKNSAIALLVITIIAVALMWQPAYWAITIPSVAAICLAMVWLVRSFSGRHEVRTNLALWLVLTAALWPLMQLVLGWTVYRWRTAGSFFYWALAAAIVFSAIQAFRDPPALRVFLRALLIFGFVVALISPLQRFTAGGKIFWMFEVPYSDIALGPFVYPNQYAAFIELLLPVALVEALSDRSGWRIFDGLAAAVMYGSVIAAVSRSGVALTTLEIITVPLLTAKRHGTGFSQLKVPAAVLGGMLVVLTLAMGPDALMLKLQQKDPYQGRREFTESSLLMIRDHPLRGVGFGNWSTAYPAYATFDNGLFANQAHNDWAQWAVEGGLPFFFVMAALAIWIVPRALQTVWGAGLVAIFLQCFVDYPIQRIGVSIVFFAFLGAVSVAGPGVRSKSRRKVAAATGRVEV
jgi:O-antigen ligase